MLINYIHKVQSIDKCLPKIILLKEYTKSIKVHSIIDLEPTSLHEIPADLLSALYEISDSVFISPYSGKKDLLSDFFSEIRPLKRITRYFLDLMYFFRLNHLIKGEEAVFEKNKSLLLCANTALSRRLGRYLVKVAQSRKIPIISYLKSVNDRKRGLSVNEYAKNPGKIFYNKLLIPNQKFKDLLIKSGYPEEKLMVIGHPPHYDLWRKYIDGLKIVTYLKSEGDTRIVIFSRGPAPHKSDEDQIITKSLERKLLDEIVGTIQTIKPNAIVWIKPHPYQSTEVIDKICKLNNKVTVKNYSVHTLAAAADAAVSMYSSSSLDVLSYRKPSIEYFIETEGFRKAHPAGSAFSDYGVVACRSIEQFKSAMKQALTLPVDLDNKEVNSFGEEDNLNQLLDYINMNIGSN